ncbi:MAG: Ig-like domain-containing protein [Chloroflexota bacterium]|jgi:hypothetical protein
MVRRYGLLALAGLLAGGFLLLALLAPRLVGRGPAGLAGRYQPVTIDLNRPIDPDSVSDRFFLSPSVAGQLRVDGRQIVFEPNQPWAYEQRYTVSLKAGVAGLNRLPLLRGASWSFELAPPRLLYLHEIDGLVNLWRLEDGGQPRRLTQEPAGVWDYAALPDGSGVLYSALDQAEGGLDGADQTLDLVLLDQAGARTLLLDCTDALCRSPAPQPGGRLVAYERQPLDGEFGDTELWLLDLDDGRSWPAPVQETLAAAGYDAPYGRYPVWSPDGRRLAAYRPDANLVLVLTFDDGEPIDSITIPANLETMAGWSPDGRTLAYTELAFGQTEPHEHVDEAGNVISHTRPSLYQHVVLVDVDGREAVDISAGLEVDEGRPAWRPSGEMLAIPRSTTGAGKQLFLVSPDGGELAQLTDDPLYNHSALAWSPDGRFLAFMRLPRADGSSNPAVMWYDMESDEISLIAEGAFLPNWWP